ncbi:hypothetical protein O181_034449 [Austropuccinia psidii MF-1]|uniref:Uncharacterized protein n=1 Tax=Austropuccinia psidii MF-1 TaxID=1389203 RepID=A0A9Q3D0U4_9BASI|nr:hypothetical protein [Austropuccinia psidii MF-1]
MRHKKRERRCLNNHQEDKLDQESNESEHEDDWELGQGIFGGLFTTEDIKMFHYILEDVILPTGVGKLPKMLGASKNGRLKASDWLTLFELVIPLIVLEVFFHVEEPISPKSKCGQFLQNTGNLVQCTRIVSTRVVRDGHAGRFANAYARYTQSSNILFNSPTLKPNHHYALHIPQQLKLWGPLFGVAEFSGEGLIGILQKNPTNNRISEIHSTLMRRVNGLQKLIAGHPQANEVLEGQTEEKEEGNYNVMEMEQ